MPRALITGVTGQDGSYLAELLLAEGWEVHGLVRRVSWPNDARIRHLDGLRRVSGDMTDTASLFRALVEVRPDFVFNLAAQSSVHESFRQPLVTADVTGMGAARLLEAVRLVCPEARVYQASSSEMFGEGEEAPQSEGTRFHPCSPYGAAKVQAHHLAVNYRESHGMFVVAGILFNHESPRRGPEFVTRKVARGVARIHAGRATSLPLGNLDARRDWGWAPDYVRAIRDMLLQDAPRDYVIGTGEAWAVRDFVRVAFGVAGLEAEAHVTLDPQLVRPRDIPLLLADPRAARAGLGWAPTVGFEELVRRMVEAEIDAERAA